MTQYAVVTKILPDGMAEVAVIRGTACGGHCGSCDSCIFDSEIKTAAKNKVSAFPGQRVVISTKSSKIYGALFLVYVLPLVLFLVGYILASSLGLSEGYSILVSFFFFAIGGVIIVLSQRTKKKKEGITYEIVSLID